MARRRQRRFHPDGPGWVRITDKGSCVGWMRPNPDGLGVQAVLYGPADWIGRGTYGSRDWLVYEVTEVAWPWFVIDEMINKPSRFHWLTTVQEDSEIVWSVRTMRPNHRGHRRLNAKRNIYLGRTEPIQRDQGWQRGQRMPRMIRLALYGEY